MRKKHFSLMVLLCSGLLLQAQVDTAVTKVEVDRVEVNIKPAKPQVGYRLELEGSLGLESQQFSTSELLGFTTSDFLNTDDKNALLNSIGDRFVLGYEQYWSIGIVEFPTLVTLGVPRDNWGFSIYQRAYAALDIPRNTMDLALFGNKKFAGQTLDLSDTYYENWFYTGLQYQFQFNIGKQPFQMGSAIILGHSHSRYALDNLTLYTEPDGAYIEVDGEYEIREHTTDFGFGIAGMGTSIDLSTSKAINKRFSLDLGISDFGIVYWTRGNSAVKDTNFRFSGIEISNVFEISDSLIRTQVDDLEEGFSLNSNQYLLNLMPFRAEVKLNYKVVGNLVQNLYASIDYLYLPGYTPRVATGAALRFNNRHHLDAEIAYGGFNALAVGALYDWRVSNRINLKVGITNIPGIAIPAWGMGTVLRGGVTYYL